MNTNCGSGLDRFSMDNMQHWLCDDEREMKTAGVEPEMPGNAF